jgi:AraC family transcriptional regulator
MFWSILCKGLWLCLPRHLKSRQSNEGVESKMALGGIVIVKAKSEGGRFYGTVVDRWRVGNLCFSESVYPPEARIRRHSHSRPYFSILLHGSYRETYHGGVRECSPASAVLHSPGEVHADQFLAAGGRIFRFEIADSDSDFVLARGTSSSVELRNGRVRCLAARLYRESHNPDRFSPLATEALALEIISEARRDGFSREERGAPRWLLQATELLHEALPDNLTLTRIAHAVGVHPVHLARVFRRRFGCSVGEYARNWRVELASRQLAAGTAPVAEVAAIAGFADQSHLCRTFKTVGGLTPNEFRATFRRR